MKQQTLENPIKRGVSRARRQVWRALRLLTCLGLLCALGVYPSRVGAQTCTPPPAGMVAWYPGDGNALDVQGGNNAALQGGATFASGFVGQAFSLDGADDFAEAPSSPAIDFGPSSPMTIETWAFSTRFSVDQYVVGKRANCFELNLGYQLVAPSATGNTLTFFKDIVGVSSGQSLPQFTWTHIAGTFDGTTLRVYINGVLAGTRVTGPVGGLTPNAPLRIGTSGGCGAFFAGLIDETSIYNRALTAGEIAAIYNAGGAGKCKSPLGVILSRDTFGDIVARLTINNTTSFTAVNAFLTLARGSTIDESAFVDGVPVPQPLGTVGPNQNVTRTVTLPGTAGVPGGFVGLMRANVAFDGGSVSLPQQITTP